MPQPVSATARPPAGFRAVLALVGSALPLYAFLARLPAARCPTGTLLLTAATASAVLAETAYVKRR
ncbi:hypothetical protein ACFY0G_21620 [Streptomyces sp. NPDC001552]|uniref:hypothetical protein n=1 Tax=Streptomyces sp. NPDC001552 TaxID=3364587 RepID=UPI0036A3F536